MVTPTTGRGGDVDEVALQRYTETLVDNGVHGLFPCGSIGEFSSLTHAQRKRVVDTVVSASGDVPVLAGCGDTSLGAVEEHVAAAADAGADAAVVVTPYYLATTQSGLTDFYADVATTAEIPVVLYNIPQLTGQTLSVETVAELSRLDNIVGLKDTSGDMNYFRRVIEATADDFSVLQGATELAITSLDVGGDGMIAGPANVFPAVVSSVYDTYRDGDRERAVEWMNSVVNPVLSAIDDVPSAAAFKYLLSLSDCEVGDPLPPLPQLDGSQRQALRQCHDRVTDVQQPANSP